MAQFYLLSVLTNAIAGFVFASDFFGEKIAFLSPWKNIRSQKTTVIVIGAAAAIVGFVKLFVPSPGETVFFAGDLLPAAVGILLGGILLFEGLRVQEEGKAEQLKKITTAVLTYRVPLGIVGVAVAFLHFLIPGAPLL
jgi:hypothetical protein